METAAIATWNKLQHDLKSFVYRKIRDKETCQDIIQDVFIKVQANLGTLKESEKITAWIFQITRNAVTDHFRKSAKVINPVDVDWGSSANELNDCVAYCLKVLMEKLPEKYRVPLHLTEVENLSQSEVAKRLNISHSGARSRVQRARKMLKERIDELYLIKTDPYGNILVCENRTPCCSRAC